jgi:hypothetical protein
MTTTLLRSMRKKNPPKEDKTKKKTPSPSSGGGGGRLVSRIFGFMRGSRLGDPVQILRDLRLPPRARGRVPQPRTAPLSARRGSTWATGARMAAPSCRGSYRSGDSAASQPTIRFCSSLRERINRWTQRTPPADPITTPLRTRRRRGIRSSLPLFPRPSPLRSTFLTCALALRPLSLNLARQIFFSTRHRVNPKKKEKKTTKPVQAHLCGAGGVENRDAESHWRQTCDVSSLRCAFVLRQLHANSRASPAISTGQANFWRSFCPSFKGKALQRPALRG